MLIAALSSFLLSTSVVHAAAWGLNDVSFLLPIQEKNAPDSLFSASDEGAFGPLLPKAFFNRVGKLASFEDPNITYTKLRVVGIRIDPCFRGKVDQNCRAQIRFVWQPLEVLSSGLVVAVDAALHTFYDLSRKEFEDLTRDLAVLRGQSAAQLADLPLSIHPVIEEEGLRGPFHLRFRKIILRNTGVGALTRMTFMKLSGGGSVWDFGGFEVEGDVLVPITVPRVRKQRQMFANGAGIGETEYFSSQLLPEPAAFPNVNWLVRDSKLVRAQDRTELVIENVLAARALENPLASMTDETDCLSCHLAQGARIWAIRSYPQLELDQKYQKYTYENPRYPLDNPSPTKGLTANLRGFGYFGSEPAISRRTIHESAEVADELNRRR
jgi:hypothetical protein